MDEISGVVRDLDIPLPSLLKLCEYFKDLNKVCDNPDFWTYKLNKDYPDYYELNLSFLSPLSPREIYVFMYQLYYIKTLINTNEPLKDIFLIRKLDLSGKNLKNIPAFNLPNLETLYLNKNQITEVPLFNLPKLQRLDLAYNKIKEVPNFNFRFLHTLYLHNNELKEVPNFDLPNLEFLYLDHNKLVEVPLFNFPNLKEIYLNNNELREVPDFDFPKLQIFHLEDNPLNNLTRTKILKKYGKIVKVSPNPFLYTR